MLRLFYCLRFILVVGVKQALVVKRRNQSQSGRKDNGLPPWAGEGEGARLQLEKAAARIHKSMLAELDLIDQMRSEDDSWSEARLKQLTAFFKALQGMEEMLGRFEERRDRDTQDTRDILEFRRELEKRIAGFVEEGAGKPVS